MERKVVYLLVLTIFMFNAFSVVSSQASPVYDMLIITPAEFIEEVQPLKDFKDSTARPTIVVTLEDIYADYSGADKAEQVKRCIADYEENHDIKYVLLMGDVDKVPIRYFLVQTHDPTNPGGEVRWFAYYMTDQYYADLYDAGGGFCDWNADGDDYYAETYRVHPSFEITNVDGVDFNWDVVVGRVPASTEAEVTNYVDKVIKYELETYSTDPWFRNAIMVSGIGGSIYPDEPDYTDPADGPPYYDLVKLDSYAASLESAGYSTTKLYHWGTADSPSPANINTELNQGAGFLTVYSHQNQASFGGGVYGFPGDMTTLSNLEKLPVIFSLGCSPAKTGPIGPNEDYIDTSGISQNYGYVYPLPSATWTNPEPPNVLQVTKDQDAVPDYLLVKYPDKGSIAFIGSMAEALPSITEPCSETYHQSIAGGEMILGEVWRDVGERIVSDFPVDSEWEYCRRWLFINMFGDPSLQIGGLDDKTLPTTTLEVGPFNYVDGDKTYVKTPVEFTVHSDDSDFATAYYLMYPSTNPHSVWQEGTSFTLYGISGDVEYTIKVMGEDTSGNREYPHNIKLVTVDNTPAETTATIGNPKTVDGFYTLITSDSLITLTSTDTGSGENIIYYSCSAWHELDEFVEYTGPFKLAEPDGGYTLEFYSFDNVYNMESATTINLILDNTTPDVSLDLGDPQYLKGTELWATSESEFTITYSDWGSGVDRVEYTLFKSEPYNQEFGPDPYTDPFTLPANPNNNAVEWTVEAKVYDILGNIGTDTVTVWVEDRAPYSGLISEPIYWDSINNVRYISSSTLFWFEPTDLDAYDRGVGVESTEYRINDGSWITYTPGETFTLTGADGVYAIEAISTDYLGNTEEPWIPEYSLDNTPPTTSLEIGAPKYDLGVDTWVTSDTELTLIANDAASGVASIKYRIDEIGDYVEYTVPFYLEEDDGVHIVEFYSIDNVGNTESVESIELILDNTPPDINVEAPTDGAYVYDLISIELSATDQSAGVADVEYSLDYGATWLIPAYDPISGNYFAVWDTSMSDEGELTILARGWDKLGNQREDETPPTVSIMYLDYSIQFTDGDMTPLSSIDIMFSEQKPGVYKLNSEPGNIFEVISITNMGTKTVLPELIIDVVLPVEESFLGEGLDAFNYLGAKAAHIYLNGVDVTPGGRWLPDLASFEVEQSLRPGDVFDIVIHYEYAFKGERYYDPDVSAWSGEDYVFETRILTATGPKWSNTVRAYPVLR